MRRLEGRVALVTGAASGIGAATAARFAAEGAAVLLTDVQDGEKVAAAIRNDGGRAQFLHQDVTSEQHWTAAVDAAVRLFGGLDVLVNNAGMGDLAAIEETSLADDERTMAAGTLTKNVALHWAETGVRVTSIHPGFIDTPILDVARGTPFEDAMVALTPMGHIGRPEDVAAGVAYLASDDAAFVTGTELSIDGGFAAR